MLAPALARQPDSSRFQRERQSEVECEREIEGCSISQPAPVLGLNAISNLSRPFLPVSGMIPTQRRTDAGAREKLVIEKEGDEGKGARD